MTMSSEAFCLGGGLMAGRNRQVFGLLALLSGAGITGGNLWCGFFGTKDIQADFNILFFIGLFLTRVQNRKMKTDCGGAFRIR